jgi:hypothetical protein
VHSASSGLHFSFPFSFCFGLFGAEKMAEEKEGQEELLFQDLLKEDSEDAEGKPKRPSRAWPPLPPGYALPSDPQELKCYNFFELWGQCAGTSLLVTFVWPSFY